MQFKLVNLVIMKYTRILSTINLSIYYSLRY